MLKARLIRWMFAAHRWLGVTLGLLMLLWCVSGVVMIYAPYPSLTLDGHDYRREGLDPIRLPAELKLPAADAIEADAAVSSLGVEMLGERAVLRIGAGGPPRLFDLSTGQAIGRVDASGALAVARAYVRRHELNSVPSIKRAFAGDEFLPPRKTTPADAIWQVRLNDKDKTVLYISSATGEVRQRTTEGQRFWNWLGTIPHWLYFTELRKDGYVWGQVIIWTSLAGCVLTLLGLFAGIRQMRRRHSTGKLASPYRGAKAWHHWAGVVSGVFLLAWVYSGLMSMQPWGLLETGPKAGEAAERYQGQPPTWATVRPMLETQLAALGQTGRDVVGVEMSRMEGAPYFLRRFADGGRTRIAADGAPAPFDAAARQRAGVLLAGSFAPAQVDEMLRGDAYFYPGSPSARFPAVKITVPEMDDTRFYLRADTGELQMIYDRGNRDFRWHHLALHKLDFGEAFRSRPLKDVLELGLMAAVTALCGLGVWLGFAKLRRGGKLDGRPD